METKRSETPRKKFNIYDDNVVGYVFAAPFIFGFVCFSLIPICMSLFYSFTDYSLASKEASFVGVDNFLQLFRDEIFMKSIAKTLQYVLISVPVKLSFALLVAYVLTRKSRMVTLYRSLYYVPSLVGGYGSSCLPERDCLTPSLQIWDCKRSTGSEARPWPFIR